MTTTETTSRLEAVCGIAHIIGRSAYRVDDLPTRALLALLSSRDDAVYSAFSAGFTAAADEAERLIGDGAS